MLILAIDTSGPSGGITLAEADEESFRLIDSAGIAGGTFSAQLVPTLSALLGKHGRAAKDLDGFAAASGPGSFTGLRVGLSAIKGLAEALRKPITTVSVLEAMAALWSQTGSTQTGATHSHPNYTGPMQSGPVPSQMIAAAMDAGRSEVFLGLYELAALPGDKAADVRRQWTPVRREREELLAQAAFLEKLRAAPPAALITSDPPLRELMIRELAIRELAIRELAAAEVPVALVARPGSEAVARIGAGKLLAGETVPVEALDANYIRRSDAEIFFKGAR